MGSIFQNAQQLWLTAKPWSPLLGNGRNPMFMIAWVLCVCARVRVCIHALTRVTAQL